MTRPADIPEAIYERAELLMDQFRHVQDDRELIARVLMSLGQGPEIPGVTHEQAKALDFIRAYQGQHRGVSPSYAEIAAAIGRGKSNVHDMLHRLAKRGVISLTSGARSITIVARA